MSPATLPSRLSFDRSITTLSSSLPGRQSFNRKTATFSSGLPTPNPLQMIYKVSRHISKATTRQSLALLRVLAQAQLIVFGALQHSQTACSALESTSTNVWSHYTSTTVPARNRSFPTEQHACSTSSGTWATAPGLSKMRHCMHARRVQIHSMRA